jgi:hypothetical protein
MTDDDFALLTHGMVGIVEDSRKGVPEHSRCFLEGDTMLSEILARLRRIPHKLHGCSLRHAGKITAI